ncbi:MAG TPA: HD domain-containing protein [Usitatibacteraceae bacterium]|nr:HD domain-containing protein [Usitatibacteraceae bacterium]
MQFRRNDFDVSNRINTTDPVCVRLEITRLHRSSHPGIQAPALARAFDDVTALYRGEDPSYEKCDTAYHDLQHVLEVALAMARLLDGYERSRGDGPAIGERLFQLGIVCALFHDVGYLRRRADRRHRRGAEYTRTHVSRGARFLRKYLPTIGLGEFADVAGPVLHFTGYERAVSAIRLPHPVYRLLGSLLGSADIIAQMSDRCYLEKCHDRLYPEFVDGGIARRVTGPDVETVFASADDLVRKTPGFFVGASRRLDHDLGGAYQYAGNHFGGANLYMEAVKQNIRFAEKLRDGTSLLLRRIPPVTIN